jgi:hypothetical protein
MEGLINAPKIMWSFDMEDSHEDFKRFIKEHKNEFCTSLADIGPPYFMLEDENCLSMREQSLHYSDKY